MKCKNCNREWSGKVIACPVCGHYLGQKASAASDEKAAQKISGKFHLRFRDAAWGKPSGNERGRQLTWDEMEALSEACDKGWVAGAARDPARASSAPALPHSGSQQAEPSGCGRPGVQRRQFRLELFVLFALFVATCLVTADYYSPVMPDTVVKSHLRRVTPKLPETIVLNVRNASGFPLFVRVGNRLMAVNTDSSMQKELPKGEHDISWWYANGETTIGKVTCRENLTTNSDWNFELVYKDNSPLLLRTDETH